VTRVLLAEDEPLVREALAAMLQGDGHDLVTAASAVDALSALTDTAQGYDAAVLDPARAPRTRGRSLRARWWSV